MIYRNISVNPDIPKENVLMIVSKMAYFGIFARLKK